MRWAGLAAGMRAPHLDGPGVDHFSGWGVPALRFESGDVIAFRRVTASSIGPPFATVWHRDVQGRWVIYSNVQGSRSCPRYLEPALRRVCADDVEIQWHGRFDVSVSVRTARLRLGLRLGASARTAAARVLWRLVPRPVWQRPALSAHLARLTAELLGAADVTLTGRTHSGHTWYLRPAGVWQVEAAAAVINGRDPGTLIRAGAAAADRAEPGDVPVPSQPLLVLGEVMLRPDR
jgi:hypothetical protein